MGKRKFIVIFMCFFLFIINYATCGYAREIDKFRFIVMGSMHLDFDNIEDYKLAVNKMKEYDPDFILFLGGMVDAFGKEESRIKALWEKFDSITNKLKVPVYNIPGWGEIPDVLMNDMIISCYLDRYKKNYYSFEYKNNLFICLDSESKGNLIDKEQIEFLRKTLQRSEEYNNIFMATHTPLWSYPKRSVSNWFKDVHPFINGKVKYVLSSMGQDFQQQKIDKIKYILTGSGALYQNIHFLPHFLVIDVKTDEVSIKIIPIGSISIKELPGFREKRGTDDREVDFTFKTSLLTLPDRGLFLKPDEVIKLLKIKAGMEILDIGAGTGFFTFRFAKALRGTGKVFATEPDINMVEYIKKETKKQGYKNVQPVHINPEGVDSFYRQHSFDIIFLCEVYQVLRDHEQYFRELKPSLKKDGRLYLLHFKKVSDFSEFEFGNFQDVINILKLRGEEFPVFTRLNRDLQHFIMNWRPGSKVPFKVREEIIQNFNKILSDRTFYSDLIDYFAPKGSFWPSPFPKFVNPYDWTLAEWLIISLEKDNFFSKERSEISKINEKRLRLLNRIFITGVFDSDRLRELKGYTLYVPEGSIIAKLKKAGYTFVRRYNILPYHYFLEFKKSVED